MSDLKVKVAIIGAGSAGLSAASEVSKVTDSFALINGGPYGTTCARVGCMPSKLLIQSAKDFHRREALSELGILGAEHLSLDIERVMGRVRHHRDRFVNSVVNGMRKYESQQITGYAHFIDPQTLEVNGQKIIAEKVIIATGSSPITPAGGESSWTYTSDEIFEKNQFGKKIAVIGTGVIGLELGHALSHLGSDVTMFGAHGRLAHLHDDTVNQVAIEVLGKSVNLKLHQRAQVKIDDGVSIDGEHFDEALFALGRRPNLSSLKLENAGIELDSRGIPKFDLNTMRIEGSPHYIAGDITADRPLLHEASDEGRIAGYNAVRDSDQCFQRRTPLAVTFTSPEIIGVGQWVDNPDDYAVGEVHFDDQGRSKVMAENQGILRVFADKKTGCFVGAEGIGPRLEHIAHLLAWSHQSRLTVFDMLARPFYHPVVEEGLRTALRMASHSVEIKRPTEMMPCEDPPLICDLEL